VGDGRVAFDQAVHVRRFHAAVDHDVADGEHVGRHETAGSSGDLHRQALRVAGAESLDDSTGGEGVGDEPGRGADVVPLRVEHLVDDVLDRGGAAGLIDAHACRVLTSATRAGPSHHLPVTARLPDTLRRWTATTVWWPGWMPARPASARWSSI